MTDATTISSLSNGPSGPGVPLPTEILQPDPRLKQAIKAALFTDAPAEAPRLGRFTVLRELGRGGMSIVYMAYDQMLDRRVALKILAPERLDDQPRLIREAQAMARLNHPNIAAVYDVGQYEDRLFLALEFIQGQSLDVWLRTHRRAWRETLGVFLQAARGLAAAHRAGLLHRDFKPANMMLGADCRVRVLDFGLVRPLPPAPPAPEAAHPEDAELVRTSISASLETAATLPQSARGTAWAVLTDVDKLIGTPAYMAPEQLALGTVDARADQFAFCVSLYEGLYGRHPFAGKTVHELWAAMLAGVVLPPPSGSKVPNWLHRVLLRGLARDPERRFRSMDALLHALEPDRFHFVITSYFAILAVIFVTWLLRGNVQLQVFFLWNVLVIALVAGKIRLIYGRTGTHGFASESGESWRWCADVFQDRQRLNEFGDQGWEVETIDVHGLFVSHRNSARPQRWEYCRATRLRASTAARLARDGWKPCGTWFFLAYFKRTKPAPLDPAPEFIDFSIIPRRNIFSSKTSCIFWSCTFLSYSYLFWLYLGWGDFAEIFDDESTLDGAIVGALSVGLLFGLLLVFLHNRHRRLI